MYNLVTLIKGAMLQDVTLIVMSAGSSSRFRDRKGAKKQWLRIGDEPLWLFVTNRLNRMCNFGNVIITAAKEDIKFMKNYSSFLIVEGGETRAQSLINALKCVDTPYVLVSDTARACVPEGVVQRVLEQKGLSECVVPYIKVSDTTLYKEGYINRDEIKLIQTPQLSKTDTLLRLLEQNQNATDESSAFREAGFDVMYVEGDTKGHKLTYRDDFEFLECLDRPEDSIFVGQGIDFHSFMDGKKMVLGGVEIDSPFGFRAHSDGDVLLHALSDALLGAIGAGDIGEWFPDNDEKYKGIDSTILLREIVEFIISVGYEIINVDITMICEVPRVNKYKEAIKESLSKLLEIQKSRINIKATTTEKMGFLGRGEGAGCSAVVGLRYFRWDKGVIKR